MNKITTAMRDAGKKVLLNALKKNKWNLPDTVVDLCLCDSSQLYKYLRSLAPDEYQAAQSKQMLRKQGRPRRQP